MLTRLLEVLGTTATQPNGPWSDPVVIYNASEMIYGPVAQPYFDPTGKTLVFDMSIFNPIYTVTAKAVSSSPYQHRIILFIFF